MHINIKGCDAQARLKEIHAGMGWGGGGTLLNLLVLYSHSETSTISMLDLHLLFLTAVTLSFAFQSFVSLYTFWAVLCANFPVLCLPAHNII